MSKPIDWNGTAALVRHAASRFSLDGPVEAACNDAAKLCEREREVQFLLAMIEADGVKGCGKPIVDCAKRVREALKP
jgi:hypothetical protein